MLDPEKYYIDKFGYYCPICGEDQIAKKGLIQCRHCMQMVYLRRTEHEWEYYRQRAIEQNDGSETIRATLVRIILDEEASKNPEFSWEMHNHELTDEERKIQTESWTKHLYPKQEVTNVPKCPTCSSTNIEKISTTSKVVGASLFGLFSKTARSQFKCKNCGYKW